MEYRFADGVGGRIYPAMYQGLDNRILGVLHHLRSSGTASGLELCKNEKSILQDDFHTRCLRLRKRSDNACFGGFPQLSTSSMSSAQFTKSQDFLLSFALLDS